MDEKITNKKQLIRYKYRMFYPYVYARVIIVSNEFFCVAFLYTTIISRNDGTTDRWLIEFNPKTV